MATHIEDNGSCAYVNTMREEQGTPGALAAMRLCAELATRYGINSNDDCPVLWRMFIPGGEQ